MKYKVLLVEDEKNLSNGVKRFLEHYNFEVHQAFDGDSAEKLFDKIHPNIILMDTMLPDTRGDILSKKFAGDGTGIIFLTALGAKEDIINGFASGADDYVTKPFDLDILLSRINALLLRMANQNPTVSKKSSTFRDLTFNSYNNTVSYKEVEVQLTNTEFKILYLLATSNDFCSINYLLQHLYEITSKSKIESRTISVHISSIRKKLFKAGIKHINIISKYNKGYRIVEE